VELGRLVLDQQYNLPFGVAVSVAVHPHPKQTFPYTYRLSSVRAKVSQNDCFELLAWKMGFGKGMTTNQKAGSSNLSGRAIFSVTYRSCFHSAKTTVAVCVAVSRQKSDARESQPIRHCNNLLSFLLSMMSLIRLTSGCM
jgi:hypothetical protein